jgi:hypothetical protein
MIKVNTKKILAENHRMKNCLKLILEYPPETESRRTKDGYPAEMSYDEFAYRRLVDTYRAAASRGLGKTRP